jgi:hypothetical protein
MRIDLAIILLLLMETASSQEAESSLRVPFLPVSPLIDGSLDQGLDSLPVCRFQYTDLGQTGSHIPGASFRMAYGADFLYLFAEIRTDSLVFRDRGYQNGDGMIMVCWNIFPILESP